MNNIKIPFDDLPLEKKRALLANLLQAKASKNKSIPLSFFQIDPWLLDQWDHGNVAYNIPMAFRITGRINVSVLEDSLREIVRRHSILRAAFPLMDGEPVQSISPNVTLKLSVIDLTEMHEREQESEVSRLSYEEARRPFDLTLGPLLRVILLHLRQDGHMLLITVHHIVFDGWSMGVFLKEMEAIYTAFSNGSPSPLPDPPIQYADFALWQRERLQGDELNAQLDYWKRRLTGNLSILELPGDRPRPAFQTFPGARQHLFLSKELTNALKELSRREGASLFMTMIAGFLNLFYRYTSQKDIRVGIPIAARSHPNTECLIGLFTNILVFRVWSSGTQRFRELLEQVRETAMEAYKNQDLPLHILEEKLHLEHNMSYNPLFQVILSFQNAPETLEFAGLRVQPLEVHNGTAMFDLTLEVQESASGISVCFEYKTDLFDPATITRMMGHYHTLMESIAADPCQQISFTPLLSQEERHQILIDWNTTKAHYNEEMCLHDMVERQARFRPDSTALICQDAQLSYGELDTLSNQLAHYLQKRGVGTETPVGICMNRSSQMLIGLLGILKAGGTYVPLDLDYPAKRLSYMLSDTKAKLILTQESMKPGLHECSVPMICLDTEWNAICKEKKDKPASNVESGNLAYIIYTSGSTGVPKGVQITHKAVVNFLSSMALKPGFTEQDTLLAVTPLSFDIAVLELFLPLTVGGKVVMAGHNTAVHGERLAEMLLTSGATVMQSTPVTWRILIEAGWRGDKQFKVLCGGESLPEDLAFELKKRSPNVWNMYGPSETTVWSTCYLLPQSDDPILIGRPINNTTVYILDSCMQPVPVGVSGELCIGGDGLARGYLNRPDLTAGQFVPDPFSETGISRLYKTGDMARYRLDGNIEYLGRLDNQVKVRGCRIELQEIEIVLREHPAISQAVLIVGKEFSGDPCLIAYIVPAPGHNVTATELRKHLRVKLPGYMIPQHFIELDRIPLTPGGKVDRKSLPDPFKGGSAAKKEFVVPSTEMEMLLANLWQDLLHIENVSVNDNFFELGGSSLLAIQLIARIQKKTGVRFSPQQIILNTLSQIASQCHS